MSVRGRQEGVPARRQYIIKTAAALGIAVHDHLIIGRGGHTSLRDLGLIPSEAENAGANLGVRRIRPTRRSSRQRSLKIEA